MLTFLKHTFENFHHTGAVAPSSAWLAKALAAPLAVRKDEPMEVLEAGPGTGALTNAIVKHLKPGDHLTLCEINACFVAHLEDRFRNDPLLKPWAHQVTVHHGPVEDLDSSQRFHHIVCGLPFNNFDPALVRHIFNSLEAAIRPGGTLNFFEYAYIRNVKATLCAKAERNRLREVEKVLNEVVSRHQHNRRLVVLNVPPAWACCLSNIKNDQPEAT